MYILQKSISPKSDIIFKELLYFFDSVTIPGAKVEHITFQQFLIKTEQRFAYLFVHNILYIFNHKSNCPLYLNTNTNTNTNMVG